MADVNKQYTFLIQIALITLCLDILIYSLSLRHPIIMKLTSPCEQNKERWQSLKCNKFEQLVYTIKKKKNNCWSVDLVAVEVGARGYYSRNVLSFLR